MTRNEQIGDLLAAGWTLQAVGDHFGITKERVRQIARREGFMQRKRLAISDRSKRRRAQEARELAARRAQFPAITESKRRYWMEQSA